ncbi:MULTISPECIES: amidohydrolase [unclassified Carboxylicivirga]|uniref:amidohydrolase n=1 Tax=Carboxylicivirga TaxID=1628153 RepID=UPI003D3505C9
MKDLKIALLQYDILWEDTFGNLSRLDEYISQMEEDTDVLILPEMFHCGFSMSPAKNAQKEGGEVLQWMRNVAVTYGVTVLGSVVVETGGDFVNRLYVVDEHSLHYYDKRHLFTMGDEHLHYAAGSLRLVVTIKGWRFCLLICYDLRFPVWSRNLGEAYDVLVYVANWPASRKKVWNTLLPARALENQSYVVGLNRIGNDGQLSYAGQSRVINARGEVICDMADNNGFAYVVLNHSALRDFRKAFPVLNDADNYKITD